MSVLSPKNQVEGQGLLDDVDVTFAEVRIANWDYNGKVPVPVPALKVDMAQDDGSIHTQYYSVGKGTDWQPSEDGKQLIAVGKATGITNSSNCALLINSLVDAGFPENRIPEDVSLLEGLRAHMTRIPAPKRGGVVKAPRADGRVFEDTVLIVGTIITLPWDVKKAATAAKGKPAVAAAGVAAKPAAAVAAADDDIDSRCSEILLEILAETAETMPNGIPKGQIPGLAFKKVAKDPSKNKIVTRIFQDAFLNAGAWVYTNGVVTMG